jgi:hypothetical protein
MEQDNSSDASLGEDFIVTEEADDEDIYARPIVVGYAFGPKKMSTMGVVMAEGDAGGATHFVFTIDNGKIQGGSCSDLRNIVHHFRRSCSSVEESVCTGTAMTTCSTSVTSLPRTSMSCSSIASSSRKHPYPPDSSQLIPVRVSFVPLDPGESTAGRCRAAFRHGTPDYRLTNTFSFFFFALLFPCRHSTRRTTRWEVGCHFTQAY